MKARDFWQRLQRGVEVAVAGSTPGSLLGTRDGFRRYFHDGCDLETSIVVVPQERFGPANEGLAASDEQLLDRLTFQARTLAADLDDQYHFFVSSDGGICTMTMDGETRTFIRSWTVIISPLGEAWGASGSVQLPQRLISGMASEEIPLSVPGTRRKGGMISSLTGGLEDRRKATALATLNGLSTMFYGVIDFGSPGVLHGQRR